MDTLLKKNSKFNIWVNKYIGAIFGTWTYMTIISSYFIFIAMILSFVGHSSFLKSVIIMSLIGSFSYIVLLILNLLYNYGIIQYIDNVDNSQNTYIFFKTRIVWFFWASLCILSGVWRLFIVSGFITKNIFEIRIKNNEVETV